jgi:hypothetical protein
MIPPLWPWKVIMLPARGPRPKLKGETVLSMRLMDDVDVPQVAQTYGPSWHFFGRPQSQSFRPSIYDDGKPQLMLRDASVTTRITDERTSQVVSQASYANLVSRNVTTASNVSPGMPIFVLNTGTVLSVSGYGYQDSRITYSLVGGGTGVISTDDVDWSTTTRVNAQRGVRVTLHNSHANSGTPGF